MSEKIPLAGVIGHPIHHSKSPAVHGHWLQENKIQGFYVPMDVSSDSLSDVFSTLPKQGFMGVNVTIPHKEAALALCDVASDAAKSIGAANTITFKDGQIFADNTDGLGFLANISQAVGGWSAEGKVCQVLGAGGASRAVVYSLLKAGAVEVRVTNRTIYRTEQLAHDFGDGVRVVPWDNKEDGLADVDLLVNTTSLGMVGQPDLEIDLGKMNRAAIVNDLVYVPLETKLLKDARTSGCKTVDGLGMLLHQAAPGFERWFGRKPMVSDHLRNLVLGI